jgi:hypothetical protein
LLKTLRHFFQNFGSWLSTVADPRNPRFIVYPIAYVLGAGLMLFLTKIGSRRQMRFQFRTGEFIRNLNFWVGTRCKTMLHPDTLAYLASGLNPEELEQVRDAMIRALIRKRCLEGDRLLRRWYRVAVDMTGLLTFSQRHCPQCLTQQQGDTTVYYHSVLEAKLVTPGGLALSIASEFVENPGVEFDKQDCELRAIRRLATNLKRRYPQLPICLLLDGLYACGPVLRLCRDNDWRYIITFKPGSAPAVFRDYEDLKAAGSDPIDGVYGDRKQTYWWVNGVDFGGHAINVLECRETRAGEEPRRFVWVTDLPIDERNHSELANQGGRVRWKIENQGFNIQKTNGYELEHAYSHHVQAIKNFYLLLQIAHIIAQLLERGILSRAMPKQIGAIRNVARLLLEQLRCVDPVSSDLEEYLARRIQIRIEDSS